MEESFILLIKNFLFQTFSFRKLKIWNVFGRSLEIPLLHRETEHALTAHQNFVIRMLIYIDTYFLYLVIKLRHDKRILTMKMTWMKMKMRKMRKESQRNVQIRKRKKKEEKMSMVLKMILSKFDQ